MQSHALQQLVYTQSSIQREMGPQSSVLMCMSSLQGQEPPGLQEEEAALLLVACSGKMAMLAVMLPKLLANGHRVLIFSQLKGVLTLLEVCCAWQMPLLHDNAPMCHWK
jgi:SNF2 family DNA or RNA helicase